MADVMRLGRWSALEELRRSDKGAWDDSTFRKAVNNNGTVRRGRDAKPQSYGKYGVSASSGADRHKARGTGGRVGKSREALQACKAPATEPNSERHGLAGGVSVGNDHFSLQMRVFFLSPSNPSKVHVASREAAANGFGGWPGTQGLASTGELHEATGPSALRGGI